MIVRTATALLISMALSAFAAQPDTPAAATAVTVKATQITESRTRQLVEQSGFFGGASELVVTLHVEGDAFNDASSFGKIKFTEATDDLGADLKPNKQAGGFGFAADNDRFRDIPQQPILFGLGTKPLKGFDIQMALTLPSRKATKIKALKGDFQVLAGGQNQTVTLTKLKSLWGKTIDNPTIKAAGLTVTVKEPNAPPFGDVGTNSLVLETKGPHSAIREVEILGANGQIVSSGSFSTSSNDTQTTNYVLNRPLDDTMTVKIQLVLGQKTLTVPFDLKDLDLP